MRDRSTDELCLERWSATRTQIQTQQRLPPDIPRTSTTSTSGVAQFTAGPDIQRVQKEYVEGTKYSFLVEHMPHGGSSIHSMEC